MTGSLRSSGWVPGYTQITPYENVAGTDYSITATPLSVAWQFGDGTSADLAGPSGYGRPYPRQSSVTHVYEAHSHDGYRVQASVRYAVSWTASVGPQSVGPYPMGTFVQTATELLYPVEQAQPELVRI